MPYLVRPRYSLHPPAAIKVHLTFPGVPILVELDTSQPKPHFEKRRERKPTTNLIWSVGTNEGCGKTPNLVQTIWSPKNKTTWYLLTTHKLKTLFD